MRIAVAGATGLTGRAVTAAIQVRGGEVVALARSSGVDLLTGAGVAAAVHGADAVIDVTNADSAEQLETMTRSLVEASRAAGVRQVVLLSIIAAPRLPTRPHYVGKLAQERLVVHSGLPYTIVRAAQYFEYGEMMVGWRRQGDVATLENAMLQPVDVEDVGDALAEAAMRPAVNGIVEVAGPEQISLPELARRTLAARGDTIHVGETSSDGADTALLGTAFLPSPGAIIGRRRFVDWLARVPRSH